MLGQISELCSDHPGAARALGGVLVATAGLVMYRLLKKRRSQKKPRDFPRDTVILHQIGRGPYAPSLTPFAIKLETYLRMAKIPYQNVHGMQRSSKGKWPWMEYNGQSVADSSFCIAYLNQVRHVDLNAHLTDAQRAAAVAFQRLVEDSLYWGMVLQRWIQELDMDFVKTVFTMRFPALSLRLFLRPALVKKAQGHGMGRHSREEVLEIARKDLTAISDFIGQKRFLTGDEPCEEDCAVFGQLSQLYWHCPTQTVGKMFREEFPVLVAYCERMKTKFWPDWDDCITHGGTRLASK